MNETIDNETDNILRKYNIDNSGGAHLGNIDTSPINHLDGFVVSMLARVMIQNQQMLKQVDNIENNFEKGQLLKSETIQ